MRHGKAADYAEYNDDFERPLVERGKNDVKTAAEKLKIAGIVPDVIISSPANRTAGTARIVSDYFNIDYKDIYYSAGLYGGSIADYLNVINEQNHSVILIVGHNPETGRLAMHFSGGKIMNFPTSAIAGFQFKNNSIDPGQSAKLIYSDLRKL